MNRPRNFGKTHASLKAIMAGVSNLPTTFTTTILENNYDAKTLKTALDAHFLIYNAASQAEIAMRTAFEDVKQIAPQAEEFVAATRAVLKASLGRKSAKLNNVGVEPDKTASPPTVDEMKMRVAKNKATRAARHTMGPKQKAAIHGEVPASDDDGQ